MLIMQKLKSIYGLITLIGIGLFAVHGRLVAAETGSGPATAPASTSPAAQSGAKVEIDNFSFTPNELTISVGTTVTWTNHDDVPHTATAKGKPSAFDSKALDTDGKFSFTFNQPGTYTYYCRLHPHMTGKIIVK
jgi:plastocyanin